MLRTVVYENTETENIVQHLNIKVNRKENRPVFIDTGRGSAICAAGTAAWVAALDAACRRIRVVQQFALREHRMHEANGWRQKEHEGSPEILQPEGIYWVVLYLL